MKDSVTILSTLVTPDGTTWIASASVDTKVIVWKREANSEEFKAVQVLAFGSKIIETLKLGILPGDVPILAASGVDMLIYLFVVKDGKVCGITFTC